MIDIPSGATVTIVNQSYHLVSAKTNINQAITYNAKPNIKDPETPHLSMIYPLIVIPQANTLSATVINNKPASDYVIPYSYSQYSKNVSSSIRKISEVTALMTKIIQISNVSLSLNSSMISCLDLIFSYSSLLSDLSS